MFGFLRKKNSPRSLTQDQIKELTKVLIIDDEEPRELRALLRKEGWKTTHLTDLDSLSNKNLNEAHIVCIDIMGVGKILQVSDGLELVKHIKERYPNKKVILYSSVSRQDIFSDSLDYVDKRLRKEASLVPFVTAIEEMAFNTFSWDQALAYAYEKMGKSFVDVVSFDQFRQLAEKSITRSGFDSRRFAKKAGSSLDVAAKLATLLSLAVG